MIFIPIGILILTAIIGMIAEFKFGCSIKAFYWFIGVLGGLSFHFFNF